MNEIRGTPDGTGKRVAIVASRFNEQVTSRLVAGARACLVEHGVAESDIDLVTVPGAWELPTAAQQIAERGGVAAIVAIGCVIEGETRHFVYVAGPAATGLARVSLDARVPISLGVLTTSTLDQALARAGGRHGNKGWDAALAALELADLQQTLLGARAGS